MAIYSQYTIGIVKLVEYQFSWWKWKFKKKDMKIITFFLEGLLSRNSIFIYLQN